MVRNLASLGIAALVLTIGLSGPVQAQQSPECFAGRDHIGGPAMLRLASERYGDFFEVYGTFSSSAVGQMRLKADGWSGAGRMFRGHEYEGGALYIQISDYTGSSLVLSVEGYGRSPFRRTRC